MRNARWLLQVDVVGSWWEVTLRLDEAGLQVDDVVSELVILGLDCLVVFRKVCIIADLLL